MNTLPDYKEFQSTRNYMQDLSKILGKAQQTYSNEQDHYWHMGLVINRNKVVSQELRGDLANKKFMLDFAIHLFHTPWGTVNIENKSPEEVFIEVNNLSDKELEKPEFISSDGTSYDVEYATSLMNMFAQMNETFSAIKTDTTTYSTSPILLYPHHFDLSLVVFVVDDDEHQIAFGVSTGDEVLPEPYFYILSGPYHVGLAELKRPDFLKIETVAFNGFLASISSIIDIPEAHSQLIEFHASIVDSLSK